MTPSSAPILAAAVTAKKRRELFAAFRDTSSLSPENAKTMEELGIADTYHFRNQVQRGAIVPLPGGKYYLDENNLRRVDRLQYGGMFIALTIVALIIALLQ